MTTERILTEYTADTRNFQRGARVYDRTLRLQQRLTNDRLTRIDRRWERSTRAILNTQTALVGIGATIGAFKTREYAEQWRNVERSLKSIGVTGKAAKNDLVDLSIRTRSAVDQTAKAVQRMAKSTDGDFAKASRRVETLQKLLAFGGADASERNSTSIQLGQALKSGQLSGDEFRSISENAPVEFLDALAKAAGVTRKELKKFAKDQRLTTDIVLKALDGLAGSADKNFKSMAISGEEALSVLNTGLTSYVGQIDEALGATATINGVLQAFGEYLSASGEGAETFAQALEIAAKSALVLAGGRGVAAVRASLVKSASARRGDVAAMQLQLNKERELIATSKLALNQANVRQRLAHQNVQARLASGQAIKRASQQAVAADKAQARAATALAGAHIRAKIATDSHTAAQARLSAAYRAGYAVMASFKTLLAFFGGPVGLALTAVALTLSVMSSRTSEIDRLTDNLNTNVDDLAFAYAKAKGEVKLLRQEAGRVSLVEAIADAKAFKELVADAIEDNKAFYSQPMNQGFRRKFPELGELVKGLVDGSVRAQEFRDRLDEIVLKDKGMQGLAKYILENAGALLDVTEKSERANDILIILTGTQEEAAAASARLGSAFDVGAAAADNLGNSARGAVGGLQKLISLVPELHKAAGIMAKMGEARKARDEALSELSNRPEDREQALKIQSIYEQATQEITGQTAALKKNEQAADAAKKAAEDYVNEANLRELTAKNQALAREEKSYLKIVDALKKTGAAQAAVTAASAAHELKKAQIEKDFKSRGSGGGGGGSADAEGKRRLREAQELLNSSEERSLSITQRLNKERARLVALLPDLIALGLDYATAEGLIADELRRVEKELENVRTKSEEAAHGFAKGILSDIRHADNLGDAVSRIADRLWDLALDPVFDRLADQFAEIFGGSDGILADLFGSIFGVKTTTSSTSTPSVSTGSASGSYAVPVVSSGFASGAYAAPVTAPSPVATLPAVPDLPPIISAPAAGPDRSALQVHIHENAGGKQHRVQQSEGGGRVDIFLKRTTGNLIESGDLDGPLKRRFNLRPNPSGA